MGRELGIPNTKRLNGGTKYNTSTRSDITNEMVLKTRRECSTVKETADRLGCSYALVRSVLDGSRACPVTRLKINQKDIVPVRSKKEKPLKRPCAKCGEKKVRPPNRLLCPRCHRLGSNLGLAVSQVHSLNINVRR